MISHYIENCPILQEDNNWIDIFRKAVSTATSGVFNLGKIQGKLIDQGCPLVKTTSTTRFISHFYQQLLSVLASVDCILTFKDPKYKPNVSNFKLLFEDIDLCSSFCAMLTVLYFINSYMLLFQQNKQKFSKFMQILNRAVVKLSLIGSVNLGTTSKF